MFNFLHIFVIKNLHIKILLKRPIGFNLVKLLLRQKKCNFLTIRLIICCVHVNFTLINYK